MAIRVFMAGERLRFDYLNHRDVLERRDVILKGLEWGDNERYPERQWFLRCYDIARDADRSFALARIDADAVEIVHLGLSKAVEELR